jgi:hypothetical protein
LRCRPRRSFVWGGAAAGCLGRSTVPRTATAGIRAGPGDTPDTWSQAVPGFDHDAGQGRAAVMTPAPATRGRADHVSSCRGHPPLVDDELHLSAISVSLPAGHRAQVRPRLDAPHEETATPRAALSEARNASTHMTSDAHAGTGIDRDQPGERLVVLALTRDELRRSGSGVQLLPASAATLALWKRLSMLHADLDEERPALPECRERRTAPLRRHQRGWGPAGWFYRLLMCPSAVSSFKS